MTLAPEETFKGRELEGVAKRWSFLSRSRPFAQVAAGIVGSSGSIIVIERLNGRSSSLFTMTLFMFGWVIAFIYVTMNDDPNGLMSRIARASMICLYALAAISLAISLVYVPRDGRMFVIGHGRTNLEHGFFANAMSSEFRRFGEFNVCTGEVSGLTPRGERVEARKVCAAFRPLPDAERLTRLADTEGEAMEATRGAAVKRLEEIFTATVSDDRTLFMIRKDERVPRGDADEINPFRMIEPGDSERVFGADGPPIELVARPWIVRPKGPWKTMFDDE